MIATIVGAACPLAFVAAAIGLLILIRRNKNRSNP